MLRQNTISTSLVAGIVLLLQSCANTSKPVVSDADKLLAFRTLNETIKPASNASITTSTEIEWSAGILPWDRYTLPVFSPDGLHAAVQLGEPPSIRCLSGSDNTPIDTTTIELHILDPIQGRRFSPLHIGRGGLLLSRTATNQSVLVETMMGESGRWIGQIDWATGNLIWLVSDEYINAFPSMNAKGDLAWSRKNATEDRFYIVVKTERGTRIIDDKNSDWLLPVFLGNDRLRVFRILDGKLHLVELDLHARDPLLTAISLPIVEEGGTRELAWQIATTNQSSSWHEMHSFYHPVLHRMVIWQPNQAIEMVALVAGSVAATYVSDGTWLVATDERIVRQNVGDDDGIHIRERFAIPIATTSKKWTHLILLPEGNRLQVHAINLDK